MTVPFFSKVRFLIVAGCLILSLNVTAQDTSKSRYTIFNPVPKELMREDMETDRPNVTETPYTVDAGHIIYEGDLVNYEQETNKESKQKRLFINQATLKLGLFKNTDLQFLIQSYIRETTQKLIGGSQKTVSGFGDVALRLKQNIYGNYNSNFSIAMVPFVKLPTNTYSDNKVIEGGLVVPIILILPNEWEIASQVRGDYMKDNDEQGHHAELMQSLSVSHTLFKKLHVIEETYYTYNFKEHKIENYLDAALAYELGKDLRIDAGLNYGVQKEATKNYFFGIALRY